MYMIYYMKVMDKSETVVKMDDDKDEPVEEPDPSRMDEFLGKVDEVKLHLTKMKSNNERTIELANLHQNATQNDEETKISRELDQIIGENQNKQKITKELLDELSEDAHRSKLSEELKVSRCTFSLFIID